MIDNAEVRRSSSAGGWRQDAALLIGGAAATAAVFVLPEFMLKAGVLLGGAACVGFVLLSRMFGRDRIRHLFGGLAVACLATCIALVIAEMVVRATFADVTTTDGPSWFAIRWRKSLPPPNALGFREKAVTPDAPEGVYRIAVIGDSFTYGAGIAQSDRMTERLQEMLGTAKFEVLNFGTPGDETVDHVRTLRDVVLPLHPDFVLMQWYTNDVMGDEKAELPVPAHLVPSESASRWFTRHSALYYLLDHQWAEAQRRLGIVENYADFMDRHFADPTSEPSTAATTALREFITLARDAGAGVGIVAFPDLVPADSVRDFPLGYLIDRVMEVCAAEHIGCIDLRHTFIGKAGEEGWWASRFDPHPGPVPNRLAAQAVAGLFGERWAADAERRSTGHAPDLTAGRVSRLP